MIEVRDGLVELRDGAGSWLRLGDVRRVGGDIDGYRVEVGSGGLQAGAVVHTLGDGGLVTFLQRLAADFRGWEGVRPWWSLEGELGLEARHDGRGAVSLRVVLRRLLPPEWEARTFLRVDAGEEMTRLAREAESLLS
jgi:hypothetical protein